MCIADKKTISRKNLRPFAGIFILRSSLLGFHVQRD
jgi:hypothetical protein